MLCLKLNRSNQLHRGTQMCTLLFARLYYYHCCLMSCNWWFSNRCTYRRQMFREYIKDAINRYICDCLCNSIYKFLSDFSLLAQLTNDATVSWRVQRPRYNQPRARFYYFDSIRFNLVARQRSTKRNEILTPKRSNNPAMQRNSRYGITVTKPVRRYAIITLSTRPCP